MGTRAPSILHPVTTLIVFGSLIALSAVVQDPVLQAADASLSCLCLIALDPSRKTLAFLLFVLLMVAAIAFLNPLFDQSGGDTLFFWPDGHPYTLQALERGFGTALMLASVVIWFACLSRSLEEGAFLSLLGPLAPSIALVLTMGLRLVPTYARRAGEIADARRALGLGQDARLLARARDAAAVVSSLATQALVGSVETAFSMQSRGFGSARRTTLRSYRLRPRDARMMLLAIACALTSGIGIAIGWQDGANATGRACTLAPAIAFLALCVLPTLSIVGEELSWRCSRSKA